MSPAMKLGNWLRKVCPCVRKSTTPLIEEDGQPSLSTVDKIVYNTLLKHDVCLEDVDERKRLYVLIGDLKISRPAGLRVYPSVEYEGEFIGVCSDHGVLSKLDDKVREYTKRLYAGSEAERIKSAEEREARLLEILKEVGNETA